MKKAYSAPDILFERFSLHTNIAASCGVKITTQYAEECGMTYGNTTVFTDRVGGCSIKIEDGSKFFNGLCYHVPIDQLALFNS